MNIQFLELAEYIKDIFLNQDKYQIKKIITEFPRGEEFFADFFSYVIFEDRGEEVPIFYSINSPYDLASKKSTHVAQVFKAGEVVFNEDVHAHVAARTGIMSTIAVHELGIDLGNKKVLIFGSGNLASQAMLALKEFYPKLESIDYTNKSGVDKEFEFLAKSVDLATQYQDAPNTKEYDYIALYTNASEPLIKSADDIKGGAFIASHISSTDHGELADEVFKDANLIIDWKDTPKYASEVQRGLDNGSIKDENILTFEDLLSEKSFQTETKYTILRTPGTPMQDLAVLKYLMK